MTSKHLVPINAVITYIIWFASVGSLIAGWICTAADAHEVAVMLGLTAIMLAAVAATLTVAGMALRTQGLIRICTGLESEDDGNVDRRLHGV